MRSRPNRTDDGIPQCGQQIPGRMWFALGQLGLISNVALKPPSPIEEEIPSKLFVLAIGPAYYPFTSFSGLPVPDQARGNL